MKSAILIRSGSFQSPYQILIGSPRGSDTSVLRRTGSISMWPRSAFHVEVKMRKEPATILRARSDTDLIMSDRPTRFRSPPAKLAEEEEEENVADRPFVRGSSGAVIVPEEEEVEFSGSGRGRRIKIGGSGGGRSGDQNENKRIENYYKEMLRSDPWNPLILRNYGKFLDEVEGDRKGAEECYSRAIVASPRDADVLSLYGKLVWETHRDMKRAGEYFERAVEASPEDCYVLGSYASFLWDAEEEDDEGVMSPLSAPAPAVVKAF